jgi:hypothetical protein
MKILVALLIGVVIGTAAFGITHRELITNNATEHYYVGLKFAKTGKVLSLSDKFEDHYTCLTSPEYLLHKSAADTSGSNIICTNQQADY